VLVAVRKHHQSPQVILQDAFGFILTYRYISNCCGWPCRHTRAPFQAGRAVNHGARLQKLNSLIAVSVVTLSY